MSLWPPDALSWRRGIVALLLAASLAPVSARAGDPWDKKPEQWTLKDVTAILFDSPWSPAKFSVGIEFKEIRENPITKERVEKPHGVRTIEGPQVAWDRELPARPTVRWWSSRTLRLAEQRLAQLQGRAPGDAPLKAEPIDYFVIAVEGSEPLRILRDAEDDLKPAVYLELPNGMPLDAIDVQFREGTLAGEDRVLFFFLRKINGVPTIPPDTSRVVFRCRATAKTHRGQEPNSLDLRVTFEPRKMRSANKPDF